MIKEQLEVFISGKEGELDDERAITNEIIESFKFKPQSSERRVASDLSVESLNQRKVIQSDIYIGIFGKKHSPPTVDEYNTARSNDIPTLIFVKEVKESENPRETQLIDFLKPLENSRTGIVYQKYNNVVDLKEKIIGAL